MTVKDFHHHRHVHIRADTSSHPPTSVRSNLGPLTTPFSPPSRCSRAVLACPTCSAGWLGLTCNSSYGSAADDSACWPPATQLPSLSNQYFSGLGFYSPGLSCPTGYTSACTAVLPGPGQTDVPNIVTKGPTTEGHFQFPLVEGETAVGCCPSGFTCAVYPARGWQTCHQVVTSTAAGLPKAGVCGVGGVVEEMDLKVTGKMDLWAPLVQINWQATDRPATITTTANSSPPTISSASTTSAPSSTGGSSVTSTGASSQSGLPVRSVIALSVSLPVVSLVFLAPLLYLCFHKRRGNSRQGAKLSTAPTPSGNSSSVERSPANISTADTKAEAPQQKTTGLDLDLTTRKSLSNSLTATDMPIKGDTRFSLSQTPLPSPSLSNFPLPPSTPQTTPVTPRSQPFDGKNVMGSYGGSGGLENPDAGESPVDKMGMFWSRGV